MNAFKPKYNKFFSFAIAMSLALFCFALLSFTGCNNNKQLVTEQEVKVRDAAPEWVGVRPHSGAYYIGVGSCSKTMQPLEYQSIAKKNALNDLASEISVRIQGQTFLNTLEVNKNFSEEFISTISTSTDEKIENYEIPGQWENEKEYWVYYRLSKAEYQRSKTDKKNMALSQANDYYLKGKEAESIANITAAYDLYMHGLFAMKEYWNDVNEFTTAESNKIYLDNELYSSLQRIATGLTIKPTVQKIVLSSDNAYSSNVKVMVEYNGLPVRGITVRNTFQKIRYMKPREGITDQTGSFTANVSDISSTEKNNLLFLDIDLNPLLSLDLDAPIQKGLIKTMRADSKQIPIEMVTPVFQIVSAEKVYGNITTNAVLAASMNSELVKSGMRISSGKAETNYLVNIVSNTIAGGSSQGFTVAFLEMSISVTNSISGEVVYQETLSSLKGLQLNADAASMEAYKKGKEKIEAEIVKSMLDAIL